MKYKGIRADAKGRRDNGRNRPEAGENREDESGQTIKAKAIDSFPQMISTILTRPNLILPFSEAREIQAKRSDGLIRLCIINETLKERRV